MIKFHTKDFIFDIRPENWLSKFRNISILNLIVFVFFYQGVSILFNLFSKYLPRVDFEKDALFEIPYTAFNSTILMPVIEDVLFFGLPHYLSGNPIIVLIVGSLWAILHLFQPLNGHTYSLLWVGMFAAIPLIFFHIRLWKSGKGWFAIVTHATYNLLLQVWDCSIADTMLCHQFFDNEFEFPGFHIMVGLASSLLLITYFLYRRREINNTLKF